MKKNFYVNTYKNMYRRLYIHVSKVNLHTNSYFNDLLSGTHQIVITIIDLSKTLLT